jgi:oxygen-independent coproporphyrinogen III oxidase
VDARCPLPSLYVHIPLCERKCLCCGFYSVDRPDLIEGFLAALAQEIALRGHEWGSRTIQTVFFGGGTPSLLTPRQLEGILSRLHSAFRIATDAEITLEANPGTVNEESLRAFRSLGVNRLSVGIQSFRGEDLGFLGRIHNAAEAFGCVDLSRTVGFDNLGIDLIYAIPGQTLDHWEENLRIALDLAPQHIAAYSLIVEKHTPLARMVRTGRVRIHPADHEARLYERTMEVFAAHGYEHYEVSNYTLPGFCCRHNSAYWDHQDYLGLGPSAHSFRTGAGGTVGERWWNVADLSVYGARLRSGTLPVGGRERIGIRELVSERIFLGLRSSGLDLARLAADLGYDLPTRQREMVKWMAEAGLAGAEGGILRLTAKGYLLCDEVCRRVLQEVGSGPDWLAADDGDRRVKPLSKNNLTGEIP